MTGHAGRLYVACILWLALAGSAAAQTISGRVVDPEGQPVAGIEVLLHAITESSGREVDRDTSRANGGFDLAASSVDPNSVYFVAVMHNGQLYIGDLLRAPFPLDQEYVVRVGVNPVDLGGTAAATPIAAPDDPRSRTAGIVVIVVAVSVIGFMLLLAIRRRPPARRRVLVELARLEEDLARDGNADPALQQRRAELRSRLKPTKST